MARHSVLPPSGAYQWLPCPGSIAACASIEEIPSEAAMLGSIAHDLAVCCLTRRHNAAEYVGYWGWCNRHQAVGVQKAGITGEDMAYVVQVDYEMAGYLQVYLDAVFSVTNTLVAPLVAYEQALDLGWLVPGMFGTGDVVAKEPFGRLYIIDLKYGFTMVEPEDNPQLKIYALGALGPDNPDAVTEVVVRIVQPRAPHARGPVREARYTPEALYEWAHRTLEPAAHRALAPDAPRVAGDHCRFCDAYEACPERRSLTLGMMPADIKAPLGRDGIPSAVQKLPDATALTGEQLDRYLDFFKAVKPLEKAVRTRAFHLLEKGLPNAPRQYKLVRGKATRSWCVSDEKVMAEADRFLPRDMITKTVLNSPAKMEASLSAAGLPKTALKHLVKSTHGKSMVPITDPKPALPGSVDTFGVIDV